MDSSLAVILRSVGAIIGGYVAMAAIVVVGTGVAVRRLQGGADSAPSRPYLAANLAVSLVGAVVGGLLCGRIAGRAPTLQVLALAAVVAALSLSGVLKGGEPGQPRWYPATVLVVCVTGILLGGLVTR